MEHRIEFIRRSGHKVPIVFAVDTAQPHLVQLHARGQRAATLDRAALDRWLAAPAGRWTIEAVMWTCEPQPTEGRGGKDSRVHVVVHDAGSWPLTAHDVRQLRRFLRRRLTRRPARPGTRRAIMRWSAW